MCAEKKEEVCASVCPVKAGDIKKGHLLVLKGGACKAIDVVHFKPGKHGKAKATITAVDIFTGRKSVLSGPCHAMLSQPELETEVLILSDLDVDDASLSAISDEGEMTHLRLPTATDQKLCERIQKAFNAEEGEIHLTATSWGEHQAITACKVIK